MFAASDLKKCSSIWANWIISSSSVNAQWKAEGRFSVF